MEDVVVEEPLRAEVSLDADFQGSNNLFVVHFWHEHWQETNNSLEENLVSFDNTDGVAHVVLDVLVEEVQELSEVPSFKFMKHP